MKEIYDEHGTRYRLASERKGDYNWLCVPGGPGVDSGYFLQLLAHLDLPGNAWLVDLPGNGRNTVSNDYDYDQWLEIFPNIVKHFDSPVLVGHSGGGQLPLLFPELEEKLCGLMLISTSPCLWLEESVRYREAFGLPDLTETMAAFIANPNQATFDSVLSVCTPYYFSPVGLEEGKRLLSNIVFPWRPAVWWQRKAVEISFNAQWIPQSVATVIISGHYDCMTPHTLFDSDSRFDRPNIERVHLDDAGHFPWVENPKAVRLAFDQLVSKMK